MVKGPIMPTPKLAAEKTKLALHTHHVDTCIKTCLSNLLPTVGRDYDYETDVRIDDSKPSGYSVQTKFKAYNDIGKLFIGQINRFLPGMLETLNKNEGGTNVRRTSGKEDDPAGRAGT